MLERHISIDELMTYSLTPVPHSLSGYMAKTDKSTIVCHLTSDVESATFPSQGADRKKVLFIDNGNARLYTLKDLPETFEKINLKILEQLPRDDVIFSTDKYITNFVKSQERARYGTSDKLLIGLNTRRPVDFKAFLLNGENKVQLFELLLGVWGSDRLQLR